MPCARADQILRDCTIADLGTELLRVLSDAARSEPAKVVAKKVQISPRHVQNIAGMRCEPGIITGIRFARAYPAVRAFIAAALAIEVMDPRTEELLAAMRRWTAAQAEEGDRANGGPDE